MTEIIERGRARALDGERVGSARATDAESPRVGPPSSRPARVSSLVPDLRSFAGKSSVIQIMPPHGMVDIEDSVPSVRDHDAGMAEGLEAVLAQQLRKVAAARGVPLSYLADSSGVARSYLWRLLDGSSSATLSMIQRLARVLGVEPLVLLGATPSREPAPTMVPPSFQSPEASPAGGPHPPSDVLASDASASPGARPRGVRGKRR